MLDAKATIIFCYNSINISCGVRDVICYLARHKQFNAMITTAGGIDEDYMKSIGDVHLGEFNMIGRELKDKSWNRSGNMIFPTSLYLRFMDEL
mmetsp:Transcript_3356/g.450  ORF Transcript_3356/g.450 Transcript_3356/m.450 type:complete len:93 (+) Transcript_3356:217-495(+)